MLKDSEMLLTKGEQVFLGKAPDTPFHFVIFVSLDCVSSASKTTTRPIIP